MTINYSIFKFIKEYNYTLGRVSTLIKNLNITEKQLLKHCFKLLSSFIDTKNHKMESLDLVKQTTEFICFLCENMEFSSEETEINRARIKKIREELISYYLNTNRKDFLYVINILDEIILVKNMDLDTLRTIIIRLIDNEEEIEIIKKFIRLNKGILQYNNSELFNIVFEKSIDSINQGNHNSLYYIALLKILYNTTIDKEFYQEEINSKLKKSIYKKELCQIIEGNKRGLSLNEIYKKYHVIKYRKYPPILIHANPSNTDFIFSIDRGPLSMKDDAFSIRKDGQNYIVNIFIADVASEIDYNSHLDLLARNNFKSVYFCNRDRTSMLPYNIERSFSLDNNVDRKVFSLQVIINNCGEIVDYSLKQDNIRVDVNLSFFDSERLINMRNKDKVSESLLSTFEFANIIASKNQNLDAYWKKKELSKHSTSHSVKKSALICRELMVLYGKIVSDIARDTNIPFTYRCQKNEEISEFIKSINESLDESSQKVLNSIYSNSVYSSEPLPHEGLSLSNYAHAGNSIRRYPDLYDEHLLHAFYFKDKEMNFDEEEHLKLIEYFNQRSRDLTLFEGEYNRKERVLRKD